MKKVSVVLTTVFFLFAWTAQGLASNSVNCWFPPGWKSKAGQAMSITKAMSQASGMDIRPRIAKSYPQILEAFNSDALSLVYVGSFVQAIIRARNLGTPIVQNVNGKELYSGILVYPKGESPEKILLKSPDRIAYTMGASSGESSAKAATGGMAALGVANHFAAASAVKAGKAEAAVVKNWWWEKNHERFPMLDAYLIPDVSITKNPDNVLTASRSMPPESIKTLADAAMACKDSFGAPEMVPFDSAKLDFSIELMKKGGIDPMKYAWK